MTVYNEKFLAQIGTGRSGHLRQRSNDLTDMATGAHPISHFISIILTKNGHKWGKNVYSMGKTMIVNLCTKSLLQITGLLISLTIINSLLVNSSMINSIYTRAKSNHGNLNESLSVDSMKNQIPSESKPGKVWSKNPRHLDRSLEIKGEPF